MLFLTSHPRVFGWGSCLGAAWLLLLEVIDACCNACTDILVESYYYTLDGLDSIYYRNVGYTLSFSLGTSLLMREPKAMNVLCDARVVCLVRSTSF